MRRYYKQRRRIWNSVFDELRMASALLPFAFTSMYMPWNTEVFCSDSSLSGFACHSCVWNLNEVESVGRWSERWRYKQGDTSKNSLGPRAIVLQQQELDLLEHVSPVVPKELSALHRVEGDASERYTLNGEFPEIYDSFIARRSWKRILAHPWKRVEAFHRKEARGTLVIVRRLCK